MDKVFLQTNLKCEWFLSLPHSGLGEVSYGLEVNLFHIKLPITNKIKPPPHPHPPPPPQKEKEKKNCFYLKRLVFTCGPNNIILQ